MKMADYSIHEWIIAEGIKNEKGDPIEFGEHLFLYDIYKDESPNLCVMKCAQCGMSTCAVLKNHFDAKRFKLDIIYTLPTDGDVGVFVAGKVNRIISNNPCMLEDVSDKDSIEQKQIGKSYEYFRGTWTKRAADMVTADRLVHDEIDTSKIETVRGYQARLQHSKYKQTHVFAHPSTPKNGVHGYWLQSDQKEYFIMCSQCGHEQYLSWSTEEPRKMSVDIARKRYRCKKCDGTLSNDNRAVGVWRKKKGTEGVKWSGYHISLMMNVNTTAAEIVEKWNDVLEGRQSMDFFYSRVLGLPYAGGGNSVGEDEILSLFTTEPNKYLGRLVCGVDTGVALRYVIGNVQGLIGFGQMRAYVPDPELGIALEDTLEYFLKKFPDLIMIIDQGGDIVGARLLREKYPGRVYLCHYRRDRKTMSLITWGEKDESGNVIVDRNRMIQLLVDETRIKGFRLFNGQNAQAWHDYALHWSHIYRVWEKSQLGVNEYVWMRNDRDDWVHATVYWRVGVSRYGQTGELVTASIMNDVKPNSYILNADNTVSFNPDEMFRRNITDDWAEREGDWREN